MADDPTGPSYEDLAALVAAQAATIERLEHELAELRARADEVDRLKLRVAELERQLGQNSGEFWQATFARSCGRAATPSRAASGEAWWNEKLPGQTAGLEGSDAGDVGDS